MSGLMTSAVNGALHDAAGSTGADAAGSASEPTLASAIAAPVAAHQGPWALEHFCLGDFSLARSLLLACYPCTPAAMWDAGFQRLRQVPVAPADAPLGVIMTNAAGPVGLGLLLPSTRPTPAGPQRMVNAGSWGILPQARQRALWMARTAMSDPATAYTALTPVPSLHRLLGRIDIVPVTHQHVLSSTARLAFAGRRAPAAAVLSGPAALRALRDDPLAAALHDHVRLGCEVLALQSDTGTGGWVPLVFRAQRRLGWLRTAEVLYSPSQALLAEHAHALAGPLLRRGYLLMGFDAHEELTPEFPCTRLFQRRYGRALPAVRGIDYLYSEFVYLHR